jgi:hypothetical protein
MSLIHLPFLNIYPGRSGVKEPRCLVWVLLLDGIKGTRLTADIVTIRTYVLTCLPRYIGKRQPSSSQPASTFEEAHISAEHLLVYTRKYKHAPYWQEDMSKRRNRYSWSIYGCLLYDTVVLWEEPTLLPPRWPADFQFTSKFQTHSGSLIHSMLTQFRYRGISVYQKLPICEGAAKACQDKIGHRVDWR